MSLLFLTVLFLFGATLQMQIAPLSFFGSLNPPILLSLLIYISLHTSQGRALYAALLAALLHDAFCPVRLGASIPFFVLIVLGMSMIRQEVFADQIVTYSLLGLAAVLCKTLYFAGIYSFANIRPIPPAVLGMQLLGSLLFGLLMTPCIYLLLVPFKRVRDFQFGGRLS